MYFRQFSKDPLRKFKIFKKMISSLNNLTNFQKKVPPLNNLDPPKKISKKVPPKKISKKVPPKKLGTPPVYLGVHIIYFATLVLDLDVKKGGTKNFFC